MRIVITVFFVLISCMAVKADGVSFTISKGIDDRGRVVRNDLDSTELKHRGYILDYLEQLRTAYNKKDIKFIEQAFDDHSLYTVITYKQDGFASQKRQYNKQTKRQFLKHINRMLRIKEKVNVDFTDIEVIRHPNNPDYYGVTLHIKYSSASYYDEGYLFQLWEFNDENVPLIHICTWQPAMIGDKRLSKEEIITIFDFELF